MQVLMTKKTTRKLKAEKFKLTRKILETLERFFPPKKFISIQEINKFIKRFIVNPSVN